MDMSFQLGAQNYHLNTKSNTLSNISIKLHRSKRGIEHSIRHGIVTQYFNRICLLLSSYSKKAAAPLLIHLLAPLLFAFSVPPFAPSRPRRSRTKRLSPLLIVLVLLVAAECPSVPRLWAAPTARARRHHPPGARKRNRDKTLSAAGRERNKFRWRRYCAGRVRPFMKTQLYYLRILRKACRELAFCIT